MGIFSDLDLNRSMPVRAQARRGLWGTSPAPGTRWKKIQRIIVPIIVTVAAVGLFLLGRMFYLILTGA